MADRKRIEASGVHADPVAFRFGLHRNEGSTWLSFVIPVLPGATLTMLTGAINRSAATGLTEDGRHPAV